MTYLPQTEPRDYQLAALQKMTGRAAFALLMRMRTGKTKVALDDFGRLEMAGEVTDLLVIAPAGCYRTWESEAKKHLSHDLLSRLLVATWVSGAGVKARSDLKTFLNRGDKPRMLLVNVEALSTAKTGAREACKKFLANGNVMVVVDESTVIKNHKALRTQFVNQVVAPLAKARRILSGLPTPRSPLDLWGQFEFLDRAILQQPCYATFEARYAIIQKKLFYNARWPVPVVVGYRNTEELAILVEPHSSRVDFRPDVPSTYSIWDVAMTKDQKRIYEDMKQMATAALDADGSFVTATQVVTQMLRLHQVLCGHVTDENGREHVVAENKTAEMMEILDDYDGKAVVWCSYDADVRKVAATIHKEYGPGSVARFWGGNMPTREEEERRFKEEARCRFMVATPSAGGRGRTWDCADLVIYYSSLNNLEHRDQSEHRVLGVAKSRGVDYIDLICPGTVEVKILEALRRKIDLASLITGDNWKEWVV